MVKKVFLGLDGVFREYNIIEYCHATGLTKAEKIDVDANPTSTDEQPPDKGDTG